MDFGWGPHLARGRWSPVTVWVTSRGASFSGDLEITYAQDATQMATVIVSPVTTTPGMVTPVEIEIAPPPHCNQLTLTLGDGRYQTKLEYSDSPDDNQSQLPRGSLGSAYVLVIGDSSSRDAFDRTMTLEQLQRGGPGGQPKADEVFPSPFGAGSPPMVLDWNRLEKDAVVPSRLPYSWMAYDGVDLVITSADELAKADARARAALMQWVEAGGRLTLQVDPAGTVWRSFLPKGQEGELVRIAGQQVIESADVIGADAIHGKARLISLTPLGKQMGWRVGWPAAPAPTGESAAPASAEASPLPPSSGLLARGPVGLGMVELVGIDPQLAPAIVDPSVTRRLWRTALSEMVGPRGVAPPDQPSYYSYGYGISGDPEASQALRQILDSLVVVPPLGYSVFIAIALCMLLLAALIGPVDGTVLKRLRQSQNSWMTALLWITLASVGAYLAPRAMRSGTTTVSRAIAIDALCADDGTPWAVWQTGVTGVFGGKPLRLMLSGAPKGAWWQGASALEGFGGARGSTVFSPLITPIVTVDADTGLRGAPAQDFTVAQWTFRTLMERGPRCTPSTSDPGAKVTTDGDRMSVTLRNLGEGAVIQSGFVRTSQGWLTLDFSGSADHPVAGSRTASTSGPIGRVPEEWRSATVPRASPYSGVLPATSAPMLSLPGPRDHSAAVDAMVASGRWACVCLKVTYPTLDLTLSGVEGAQPSRTCVMRLVTPIAPEDVPAPESGAEPTP